MAFSLFTDWPIRGLPATHTVATRVFAPLLDQLKPLKFTGWSRCCKKKNYVIDPFQITLGWSLGREANTYRHTLTDNHSHIHLLMAQKFRFISLLIDGCLWTEGGSWNAWREPAVARGWHVDSTQKGCFWCHTMGVFTSVVLRESRCCTWW